VRLFDWDLAGPGPRVKDLALMARRLLDLGPDGPPPQVQGSRIRRLLDAYGFAERDEFVFQIIRYQAEMIAGIAASAAHGEDHLQSMMYRWASHPDNAAALLAWIVDKAQALQVALGS
jgi:hypothetical protein